VTHKGSKILLASDLLATDQHKMKLPTNPRAQKISFMIYCHYCQKLCTGLIEPDTLIRDNLYQLLRCRNGTKRTNKQYSKEYKEEAVALIRDQGYTVPEAAKSLGIASNILYRW
jgi:hypothetical protein